MSNSAMSPLESLKAGFRRACVRKLVGDEEGAVNVLKNEIPKLVVTWAKTSSLDAPEKKAKLKELFDDESARADELSTAFDLFAGRFEARVAQLISAEVSSLTDRFEELIDGVKRTLEATQAKAQSTQQEIISLDHSSVMAPEAVAQQDSLITDAIDASRNIGKLISRSEKNLVESITDSNEPHGVDLNEEQSTSLSQEEKKDLPPVGIGLRFDEIEEMIDEILSF